jgi:hypothetical protein
MSSITINGDTSGSVIIQAPAVSGSGTVNIPTAASGTMMVSGNMPAFSAYSTANTSITSAVSTKVPFTLELFDTNNNFDSTTNYRFTPTVAGYYQLNAGVYVYSSAPSVRRIALYKNGITYQYGSYLSVSPPSDSMNTYSGLVYFNGSTDYAEVYVYDNGTSPVIYGNASSLTVYFNGSLVRSA